MENDKVYCPRCQKKADLWGFSLNEVYYKCEPCGIMITVKPIIEENNKIADEKR